MSLTGFLQQSREIRLALRETFPCTLKQRAFPALQAPPLTRNYALVGQAFDYLLRFHIQRENSFAPRQSHWVADWIRADLVAPEEDEQSMQEQQREIAARPFLEQAHAHHEAYLNDGKITDKLLTSCLNLAMIDGLVRAGEVRGQLGVVDPRDLQDLRNLFAIIPSTPFLDTDPCILNPVFPFPSGADCDLLIGSTLIEIKTTKFSEIKQEYYQQLLGYYLLNFNDYKQPRVIRRIGVYFSRHGYLWSISIDEIGKEETFRRFLPLWNEHVKRYHHARRGEEKAPTQSLSDLTAQVDRLTGIAQYTSWLSQLSEIDFLTWQAHPAAPYYAPGAIEMEEENRRKRPGGL